METETTAGNDARPTRPVRIRLLRIAIFAQLTVLGVTAVMILRRASVSAERLAVDVGYIRAVGVVFVALVAGGLALVLRTYWRPERSTWHMLSCYFWVTGIVLLLGGLAMRFLVPYTLGGGAVRVLPGGLFMAGQIWIGEWAGRVVKQRAWGQQRPGYGDAFR